MNSPISSATTAFAAITAEEQPISPGQGERLLYSFYDAKAETIGTLQVEHWPENNQVLVHQIAVPPAHRRKQVATTMLEWLQQKTQAELVPVHITISGWEFWCSIMQHKDLHIGEELRSTEYDARLSQRRTPA